MPGSSDPKTPVRPESPTFQVSAGGQSGESPRPGAPPPSRHLPPGTILGRGYQIISVIGEGGMGIVYRAHDAALERMVAVKALHTNLMGDAGIRRRFLREARLMRSWSHPHVATVYDLIDSEAVLAIVMELIEGPSLHQSVAAWRGQGVPFAELPRLFCGVLDAMADAHRRGIIHRDLKPHNILLQPGPDGFLPKVIDFGIAKVLEGTTYTMTGALMGTARYMAPEQARTPERLDHRADIYSLGVTLFEAVCGRCPFEHENHFALMMAHVTEPPPLPSALRPDTPPDLEALILACLAKDPRDRPQTCEDIQQRLLDALQARPPRPPSAEALPARVEHPHGSVMLQIPAGSFRMGTQRREVWLDAFHLDRLPVTNQQFLRFLEATGYRPEDDQAGRFLAHWRGGRPAPGGEVHPVVFVSWLDAQAYSNWAGLRLPSEAEWEKAARGIDGRRYPWGHTSPTPRHAHFQQHPRAGTAPVGAHPEGISPYGIEDMAGNTWEWCEDADEPEFYQEGPPSNPRNPSGPERPSAVVRGGAWMFDAQALRTWSRSSFPPTFRLEMVGFRCAR